MMGDGVNFELPKEERDEVLRPDFNNLQRTRSQSLIASWGRVHSARTVMRTSFYQKWSSVHQFPDTIDPVRRADRRGTDAGHVRRQERHHASVRAAHGEGRN